MQQTLLALVAILTFSVFALQQHEVAADVERFAITAEVEFAAQRLARQRLATLLTYPFDEADVGVTRVRTSPAGLSALGPDDGETADPHYDDVDDFHGAPAQTVSEPWMDGTIDFAQAATVRYVTLGASGVTGSAAPTLAKEVTVEVRAAPAGFIGTPPVAARLSQVVTPSSQR